MITVKFLGGAKKSFSADSITLDKTNLTIEQLLEFLVNKIPESNKR